MTPCDGCGRPIIWAETEDGTRIPLDPRPAVYQAMGFLEDGATVKARRTKDALVSHFSVCPTANEFSGEGKDEGQPELFGGS